MVTIMWQLPLQIRYKEKNSHASSRIPWADTISSAFLKLCQMNINKELNKSVITRGDLSYKGRRGRGGERGGGGEGGERMKIIASS